MTRPHTTFRMPAWFNAVEDPFPELEQVQMDKGDVLIMAPSKTGQYALASNT